MLGHFLFLSHLLCKIRIDNLIFLFRILLILMKTFVSNFPFCPIGDIFTPYNRVIGNLVLFWRYFISLRYYIIFLTTYIRYDSKINWSIDRLHSPRTEQMKPLSHTKPETNTDYELNFFYLLITEACIQFLLTFFPLIRRPESTQD